MKTAREVVDIVIQTFLEAGVTFLSDELVVISGGEPLRQNLDQLVELLLCKGFKVQIESNGVFEITPDLKTFFELGRELYLVVSPKTKKVNAVTAEYATCFKYVLSADEIDPEDMLPLKALGHKANPRVARPPAGKLVYINPADHYDEEANKRNLAVTAEAAMKFGYRMGVQMHKILTLE